MRRVSAIGHRCLRVGCASALAALWGCATPSLTLWAENGPIIQPEERTMSASSGTPHPGHLAHRDATAAADDELN